MFAQQLEGAESVSVPGVGIFCDGADAPQHVGWGNS
jgi:hypothetical protein